MTEQTLSDKTFQLYRNRIINSFQYQAITLHQKDFIKKLKEGIKAEWEYNQFKDRGTGVLNIQLFIDKLAGEKIIN
jgi:hypothetical protein